mmetsp:Transcript_126/g.380  ORF Transcript_126/g.380 Transcript_126/m.380 type:complete len:86 (+) Transcript_126:173-430(+)
MTSEKKEYNKHIAVLCDEGTSLESRCFPNKSFFFLNIRAVELQTIFLSLPFSKWECFHPSPSPTPSPEGPGPVGTPFRPHPGSRR